MRRVVAIANGKGGVGKTSLTAGLAGLFAASGYRVLTVDADPQGNLRRDLGYADSDGQGLAAAITEGTHLTPIRGVRENLDVVPGGVALEGLVLAPDSDQLHGLRSALDSLRPHGQAHEDYDLVLIDTPPGEAGLQSLVFAAADYLIIPTRSDDASLDGLVRVATRFAAARDTNPGLTLLGVLLFGVRANSVRARESVRASLVDTLDGAAPVFQASIRYLESAAIDMRRRGLLPHELEQSQLKEKARRIARLKRGSKATDGEDLLSRDASGIAGDYLALAREILDAIAERETPAAHAAGVR